MATSNLLPMLIAVLVLLLNPPIESYSLNFSSISPREWIGLSALRSTSNANDNPHNGPEKTKKMKKEKVNGFEKIVRKLTKNENYHFGDVTKSAISSTTHGFEDVVRSVTKNEDYHFGDFTKSAVSTTTHGFENAIRSVTGNDEYRFGDLTRGTVKRVKSTTGSILTYSEKTLHLMREANVHEAIELLNYFWENNMTYHEQREAFVVFVYLGAIIVLSYNFIANLMSGMVFAAAWASVSSTTGTSPLAPGMWGTFLQTRSTLDLIFGGPFLPVRVAATIPWFFKYRKMVLNVAYHSPLFDKYPILNRCIALLGSWAVLNLISVGGITFGMVYVASFFSGIPIFPKL